MRIIDVTLIAFALSLDAFGVALSVGLSPQVRRRGKILFAVSFGFFQFLFSIIGAYAGAMFNSYIMKVPGVIGGLVTALVGILMVKEGFSEKKECILAKTKMYFILGISVSIDALVIGFTVLNNINSSYLIISYTIYIGIVTLILSLTGFFISRYLKKINLVCKYADYLGGIVLIIFGIKMMF